MITLSLSLCLPKDVNMGHSSMDTLVESVFQHVLIVAILVSLMTFVLIVERVSDSTKRPLNVSLAKKESCIVIGKQIIMDNFSIGENIGLRMNGYGLWKEMLLCLVIIAFLVGINALRRLTLKNRKNVGRIL